MSKSYDEELPFDFADQLMAKIESDKETVEHLNKSWAMPTVLSLIVLGIIGLYLLRDGIMAFYETSSEQISSIYNDWIMVNLQSAIDQLNPEVSSYTFGFDSISPTLYGMILVAVCTVIFIYQMGRRNV